MIQTLENTGNKRLQSIICEGYHLDGPYGSYWNFSNYDSVQWYENQWYYLYNNEIADIYRNEAYNNEIRIICDPMYSESIFDGEYIHTWGHIDSSRLRHDMSIRTAVIPSLNDRLQSSKETLGPYNFTFSLHVRYSKSTHLARSRPGKMDDLPTLPSHFS